MKFAIKKKNLLNLPEVYVAKIGYILPYTAGEEHVRFFDSREEANEEIRNEYEVIVEWKNALIEQAT
jgi:hypothetical protein